MSNDHTDPRFQRALNHVLNYEGRYVDHPNDPGGATKFGITRRTLASWRNVRPWWKLPKSAVKKLGRFETGKIYFARYWLTSGAPKMPEALGFAVFDFAVNSGPMRAVKQLQRILNVRADGVVGPVTEAAIRRYCEKNSQHMLVKAYVTKRLRFLQSLGTFAFFGKGWRNRLVRVSAVAHQIIQKKKSQKKEKYMDFIPGYKTYLVAMFMLFAGVLELLGVNLPAIDAENAMQLVMEALAVIFLRKGLKSEIANA